MVASSWVAVTSKFFLLQLFNEWKSGRRSNLMFLHLISMGQMTNKEHGLTVFNSYLKNFVLLGLRALFAFRGQFHSQFHCVKYQCPQNKTIQCIFCKSYNNQSFVFIQADFFYMIFMKEFILLLIVYNNIAFMQN